MLDAGASFSCPGAAADLARARRVGAHHRRDLLLAIATHGKIHVALDRAERSRLDVAERTDDTELAVDEVFADAMDLPGDVPPPR